jgi:two-component system, chemotaxis family, response regulator WspF
LIVGQVAQDAGLARAVAAVLVGTEYRLLWSVKTGGEALRRNLTECVDVLLLSADVADLSAADITRRVLVQGPCAIILLADTGGLGISSVYDAMGAGAQDVVPPPRIDARGHVTGAEALLRKLRVAGRLRGYSSGKIPNAAVSLAPPKNPQPILAIGASTGGPQALLTLLSALPKPFPAAILLVQHVDSEFSQGLATWLQEGSGIQVHLAHNGDTPLSGAALLASSQDHLVMTAGGSLRYRPEPRELAHRPSVDVLFESLAEHCRTPGVAVLLTGMGRDGAEGMLKLRGAGWHTIAQDQATCVVYGMPKAAAQLGAACKILALPAIAGQVTESLKRARPAL